MHVAVPPAAVAADSLVRAADGMDSHELLRVRSFLDHNRPYTWLGTSARDRARVNPPACSCIVARCSARTKMRRTSFAICDGGKPDIGRHGLLVPERHRLRPATVAAHLDRTPAIAYDATHGYSEYLVEAPVFLRDEREAGLVADERRAAAFPTPELATVTLNYFTAARMAEA